MSLKPPKATSGLMLSWWDQEKTRVFQIEVGETILSRRLDSHEVNGTKLLNIARLTRGRRDSILKNEPGRRVVKSGPMHLKGVWIGLARARVLADEFSVSEAVAQVLDEAPQIHLTPAE
ncbi:hypothetical protein CXG81DRAFT_9775, partial [Caulochytrium protostelioides]